MSNLPVFVARRLLLSIPVIIGVAFITFVVAHVIVPNPAKAWIGLYTNPELIAAYTARYHLNDPIWLQFFYYIAGIATGNWGISPTTSRPVLTEIETYFPATLELVLASVFLSFIVGVPLGAIAAVRNKKKTDLGIRALYLTGVSSPPFLAALILQFLFAYFLKILPPIGQISAAITPPKTVTGMAVVDSILAGNVPAFVDSLDHLLLPTIALTILVFGLFTRLSRSSMLEVLGKDYMRTARAKGLSNNYSIVRHGLRTALIPPVTILAVAVGQLLGGALVIENVFGWPGIGLYTVEAIQTSNFPDIVGVTLIFALGVVLSNLIADVAYAILDPRIRL
jgi:ABC-type dipeptide/oligopeptide/nickel transport system permease component